MHFNFGRFGVPYTAECQARYEAKITAFVLEADPYCIVEWTEAPETIPKSEVQLQMALCQVQ